MSPIALIKSKLVLASFLCLGVVLCSFLFMDDRHHRLLDPFNRTKKIERRNELDGCRHVYIDMGTNIGVQIRKLYQPHLYPNAPVLPLFKDVFGNASQEVCSIGFEANPVHDDYLTQFEQFCRQHNWRVKIFKSVAVSVEEGNQTFYIEPENNKNNQWGASFYPGKRSSALTLPTMNIVAYIRDVVLTRQLPSSSSSSPSRMMMKSDIEGHDSVVLANLILQGVYCSIDFIYGEHFNSAFQSSIALLQKYSKSCPTKLVYLDDETYHDQRFPFIVSHPAE